MYNKDLYNARVNNNNNRNNINRSNNDNDNDNENSNNDNNDNELQNLLNVQRNVTVIHSRQRYNSFSTS